MQPRRAARRPSRQLPGGARLRLAGLVLLVAATASGCSADYLRVGVPEAVTPQGARMLRDWQGSVVAAAAVGVFVWFLIGYAAFVYRKRSDELPRQVRYNLPVEVLYTVVPFIIVGVFFYYTAVDEIYVNKLTANPDLKVNVTGFQWSWQFDYVGTDVQVTGRPGVFPELVVPTDRTIRFIERSPDVNHSFWVPAFVFKRDVIPGRVNEFEVTITEPGTYAGRCAELCGEYHNRMLFTVKAVAPAEFDRYLAAAQANPTAAAPLGTDPSGGTS